MSLPLHIHVIDDEPVIRDCCVQALTRSGCDVSLSENGTNGIHFLRDHPVDVVILDLKLPDIEGLDLLRMIQEEIPETFVIVITGYPTVKAAVDSMKMGAYDFIPKPFNANTLRTTVTRALETRRLSTQTTEKDMPGALEAIIGVSPIMRELTSLIRKSAQSDYSVLITGETGTGKEMVARALHTCSKRRWRPFITVDAGGLVDTLIESELFGHVKGAFTGAHSNRAGRFELADGGTLFLDEVTNMDYRTQGKLLRVLQDREVMRVGSAQRIPVDVRIIAASNSNLLEEINIGKFRVDLYYRLNVIQINLPPLRERKEDIPVLAEYFLGCFKEMKPSGRPERLSSSALSRMIDYPWPGNVRELEHTIKRAVALCEDHEVNPFELSHGALAQPVPPPPGRNHYRELNEVEREHIEHMLRTFNNNKTQTARALGIDRKTLWHKLRKYHILGT